MQTETSLDRVSADTRRRIAGHIASLGSPDVRTSYGAERRLMRFGARAAPQLLPLVADDSPQVRFRVAWILGKSRDPRAYPALSALVEDPDEAVRYDATLALGELGDPRAAPLLEELALRVNPEDDRLGAALSALNKLAGGEPDWTRFVACAWCEELSDTREDIYILEDGQPLDAPR